MQKMLDKHLIYIGCLLLLLPNEKVYEPVMTVLLSLFVTEISFLYNKEYRKYIVLGVFLTLCIFLKPLTFFLPVLLYDFAEDKSWYGLASVIIFFINMDVYGWNWQIGLWWVLGLFVVVLALRTSKQVKEHEKYILLRDSSVEAQESMKRKNRELLEKQDYEINLATLTERNRIAREIHDNVGHMLSRCILQMGALMAVNKNNELLYNQLSSVNESLNEAMNNIRESVHDLHDESIDLKQALLEATSEMKKNYNFKLDYDIGNQAPRNVKYCMIAIVKEAMANIVKHSNATSVNVMLREHPGFYQLAIEDNGTVINKNKEPGIGLTNMTERVEAIGGTINFNTDQGFKIMVFIKKEGDNKSEGNRN